MKLTVEREKLLTPLQAVIGVVERRQTMPVLANVLLGVRQGQLYITATDLEVELVAATEVTVQDAGDITVPGRNFNLDRQLLAESELSFHRQLARAPPRYRVGIIRSSSAAPMFKGPLST